MQKKKYVTPCMALIELECSSIIAYSSGAVEGETDEVGTGNGSADDSDPDLAGRYRGVWGNLWADPEK